MKTILSLATLVVGLVLTGCQAFSSRPLVARSTINTALTADHGTVTDVRLVTLEGRSSEIGRNAGLIGLAAGTGVGHGTGRYMAVAGGYDLGEVLGAAVEERLTRKSGQMLTVRLDSGRVVVVTQNASAKIQVGDEVLVTNDGRYSEILLPGS